MRWALVLAVILVAGCGEAPTAPQAPTSESNFIIGVWKLREVGGGDPRRLNIDSFQLNFKPNGKLAFEAKITGQYAGMAMKSDGTWKFAGSALTWTAGKNAGSSKVTHTPDKLQLEPDPVLAQPGGKGPIDSVYGR